MITEHAAKTITLSAILLHVLLWTLVPFWTNSNVPLDIILNNPPHDGFEWGYHHHPPLLAWLFQLWRFIMPASDLFVYLLAQLAVGLAMLTVWQLARLLLDNEQHAMLATLMLQGVLYHNYVTPELNHNTILLPLWGLALLAFYTAIHHNGWHHWMFWSLSGCAALLAKYTSFLLILAMLMTLILSPVYRHHLTNRRFYVASLMLSVLFLPHGIWLIMMDFPTLSYALARAAPPADSGFWQQHVSAPLTFLFAQIMHVIPLALLALGLRDTKIRLLTSHNAYSFLLPLIIIPFGVPFVLAVITGITIRTQWATPFFLLIPILLCLQVHLPSQLPRDMLSRFARYWLVIFTVLLVAYPLTALAKPFFRNDIKRTQFVGRQLTNIIENHWRTEFIQPAVFIASSPWLGGNVRYYSTSSPQPELLITPLTPKDYNRLNHYGGILLWQDNDKPHPCQKQAHKISLAPTALPDKTLTFSYAFIVPHDSCLLTP